jgi:hypothetical protein
MIDRLAALVKHIVELRRARLKVCHCVKEFHLRWIHPLDRRKTLSFECPRMADPAAILWRVTSSSFLYVINDKFALI